jgi:hypothetical protein
MVIGSDTTYYALSIGFLDTASRTSENDSMLSVKISASQKAKKNISVYLTAKCITADSNNFQPGQSIATIKTGDSIAEVKLKIKDNGIDDGTKTFVISLDSVSNGFLSGKMRDTVSIFDNDTFYTIVYSKNGADSGMVPTTSQKYKAASRIIVPGNSGGMKKYGYSFSGWNTLANGTGTDFFPESTYIIGEVDDTLYTKWTINQYTISFDAQGGSVVDA